MNHGVLISTQLDDLSYISFLSGVPMMIQNARRIALLIGMVVATSVLAEDTTRSNIMNQDLNVEIVDLGDPRPVLVVRAETAPQGLGDLIADVLPRVRAYIESHGIEPSGPAFMRYLDMTNQFAIEAGWPVAAPIEGKGDIEQSELPGGKAITALFTGPPGMVGIAWSAVSEYATANGYAPTDGWIGKGGYDVYVNDPAIVGIDNAQTRLYLPISDR